VGFEVYVERAAAGFVASFFEGEHFGVLHAIVGVSPRTHDAAVRIRDDCADVRIGRRESDALARQVKNAAQELFVSGKVWHLDA